MRYWVSEDGSWGSSTLYFVDDIPEEIMDDETAILDFAMDNGMGVFAIPYSHLAKWK